MERWFYLAFVVMIAITCLILPNVLLYPTAQSYAIQIFLLRIAIGLVGDGGLLYFAKERDYRYLPVPLLVVALSIGMPSDLTIARAAAVGRAGAGRVS